MADPLFKPWRPHQELPAFIAAALLCAWISNAFAGPSRHLSWNPAQAQAPATQMDLPAPSPELLTRFPPIPDRPESDIGLADARWLHEHGALFLDARRSAAYAQGHIPGARSLSPWEDGLEAKVDQLAALAPDLKTPVVVYCAGGGCTDSHLLAQKLWLAGFKNVRVDSGGFPEWEAAGAPLTRGETP